MSETGQTGHIETLKRELAAALEMRDKIKEILEGKPFLKLDIRQKLKASLAAYEAKAKKIKSDLAYIDLVGSLTPEELERMQPRAHYQHHRKNEAS